MWKLSIEDDQTNQTVVDLVRSEYSVGRDVTNTVRLTERNISRKHAILSVNGAGWIVKDLGSYNGCFVNGSRVSGEHSLKHGDLVQLGDYRLELLDEALTSQSDSESKTSTLPGRQGQTIRDLPNRLVMVVGPAVGASFPLVDKRIVIGRGEDCDLPINDTSVSRVHAEIHMLDGGKYEIVDRDSSNGVRVNGVELNRALLDAGDVVELGDVQLKFILAGQPFHPQEPLAPIPRRALFEQNGGDGPSPSANRGRTIAVVAALSVIAAAAVIVVGRRVDPPVPAVPEVNPAAKALAEAQSLLAQGDTEGAIKKSQEIPEDSNLRESTVFKEIQAKWADGLFDQASKETDRTKKRTLLDFIAKSPDVGSMQRKRAANEIAALDADSVGIDQLPTAETHGKPTEAPSNNPPAETAAASTAPAPKKKGEQKSSGLVRDTPF